VSITALLEQVENLQISQDIGGSIWFPIFESLHVLAAVFVFGSLLTLDVRLLGLTARDQSVSRLSKELLPWTWVAFLVALVTGLVLFATRASAYYENTAMRFKALALLLAAVNMTLFHFGPYRRVSEWDLAKQIPLAARSAGAASLVLWGGVMLAGRWIGHLS
jgi:hypothetical protein